jgi:hypothetical protein
MGTEQNVPDGVSDGAAQVDPAPDSVAAQRRLVEIRCGIAEVASKAAEADLASVFDALNRYGTQAELQAEFEAAWDPAAVREAKDGAHRAFTASISVARDRRIVESAATVWLDAINRINGEARSVQMLIRREREATTALLAAIDRQCVEAGASRARADAAIESCLAARRALEQLAGPGAAAELEPAFVAGTGTHLGAMSSAIRAALAVGVVPAAAELAAVVAQAQPDAGATAKVDQAAVGLADPAGARSPAEPMAESATATATAAVTAEDQIVEPETPAERAVPDVAAPGRIRARPRSTDAIEVDATPSQFIVRLARHDAESLARLAARLASDDAPAAARWQEWLAGLVNAADAAAIDQGSLEFPAGHPFWSLFTRDEARGIGRSLAALGFRHDGSGGFAEGRVPAPHDLVLAVGSAGLLPVRVRRWPGPDEIADLYRGVRVATDILLAETAQFLTLGEVVSLLGWRAEPLTDLWNEWPRVKPLLLSADETPTGDPAPS